MQPLFTAALLTIAKSRKQPKCPRMDDWTKKMYVYTVECHSIKKEILPFATRWIDPEGIMVSEVREKQIFYDLTYLQNLKHQTHSHIYKYRVEWWLPGSESERNGKTLMRRYKLPIARRVSS